MRIYGDALPERGAIRVEVSATISSGVTGVIASVISMLTGASGEGGFKGLAGKFERRNMLSFSSAIPLAIRFIRQDNFAYVDAVADLAQVPTAAEQGNLMNRCLSEYGGLDECKRFKLLLQDRVQKIQSEYADNTNVFVISKCERLSAMNS